jgi:hypothetical protein
MPKPSNDTPAAARAEAESDRVAGELGRRVILALGRPADVWRVQVRRLWESSYRVNVFLGTEAATARLANSYFLKTDGDGNIVTSVPPLARPEPVARVIA